MLALTVAGGPHDPDFGDDADYGQARVFRLLIPLGPEESVGPVTLPIPPMPDFPRVPALPNRVPKSLGMPSDQDADGPSEEGAPGDSPVDPNEMIERESPDPAGHETSAENDRPNTIQMERTS